MSIFNKNKKGDTVTRNSTSEIKKLKSSLIWVKLQN